MFAFISLTSVVYDLSQILGLSRHSEELITAAQQLLTDEHSAKRRKILSELLCNLKDNAELENRDEDEEWFEGNNGFKHWFSTVYNLFFFCISYSFLIHNLICESKHVSFAYSWLALKEANIFTPFYSTELLKCL